MKSLLRYYNFKFLSIIFFTLCLQTESMENNVADINTPHLNPLQAQRPFTIEIVTEKIKSINPGYDPENLIRAKNCVLTSISCYNLLAFQKDKAELVDDVFNFFDGTNYIPNAVHLEHTSYFLKHLIKYDSNDMKKEKLIDPNTKLGLNNKLARFSLKLIRPNDSKMTKNRETFESYVDMKLTKNIKQGINFVTGIICLREKRDDAKIGHYLNYYKTSTSDLFIIDSQSMWVEKMDLNSFLFDWLREDYKKHAYVWSGETIDNLQSILNNKETNKKKGNLDYQRLFESYGGITQEENKRHSLKRSGVDINSNVVHKKQKTDK